MKIIICLDDSRGMAFNRRRQSRDRRVLEDIAGMTEGATLYVAPYSARLLSEAGMRFRESGAPLAEAGVGDYCFLEVDGVELTDGVEELTVYRWNRRYPADLYFEGDPASVGLSLVRSEEFEGYSHERITKEVYSR